MKSICLWLAAVLVATAPAAVFGQAPPVAGDRLEGLRLMAPEDPTHRAYLGLVEGGEFDILDISGRLLIVEIFSMYCPHCQREAPSVNRLYEAIAASAALREQAKLIGIGVGNSAYEVDHFRNHYQIPFALFPDEDFVIHQSLGEVRTPYFLIVDLGAADKGRVLWTEAGKMDSLESYLERLKMFLAKKRDAQ
jgi:thiol-disulfide isomerase/thioredoxin